MVSWSIARNDVVDEKSTTVGGTGTEQRIGRAHDGQ